MACFIYLYKTLLAGLSLGISCTACFRPGPSSSCCSCSCLLETGDVAYFFAVSSHVVCLWGVNEDIANKRLSFLPRPSPVPSPPAPPQKSPRRCSAHRLGNGRLGSPTDNRNAHFSAVGWRCESPRPPAAPGHVVANHGQRGEEVHVQPLQLLDRLPDQHPATHADSHGRAALPLRHMWQGLHHQTEPGEPQDTARQEHLVADVAHVVR